MIMAKKAIYTKIDNTYYKVNQDTTNPTEVVRMPRTHSQMNTDDAAKTVRTTIWINTLDGREVYSNKELYDEMIQYLTAHKTVSIDTIENHFIMCCDYSVYNEKGEEINHNVFTKRLDPRDAIYVLGVSEVSELIYKQVKVFNTDVALNVKNEYPMGIMRNASKVRYTLVINDLSIYQDLDYTEDDKHSSWNKNSFPMSSSLDSMTKVYSTFDNGIAISAVEIPFIPRKIVLDINITLDDIIVVYDEMKVKEILYTNMGNTAGDGEDSDDDEGEGLVIVLNGGKSK